MELSKVVNGYSITVKVENDKIIGYIDGDDKYGLMVGVTKWSSAISTCWPSDIEKIEAYIECQNMVLHAFKNRELKFDFCVPYSTNYICSNSCNFSVVSNPKALDVKFYKLDFDNGVWYVKDNYSSSWNKAYSCPNDYKYSVKV